MPSLVPLETEAMALIFAVDFLILSFRVYSELPPLYISPPLYMKMYFPFKGIGYPFLRAPPTFIKRGVMCMCDQGTKRINVDTGVFTVVQDGVYSKVEGAGGGGYSKC